MRRFARAGAMVLALSIATAGCGSRLSAEERQPGGTRSSPGSSSVAPGGSASNGPRSGITSPARPPSSKKPVPTPGTTTGNPDFPLSIEAPVCVRRGTSLPVTIVTEPGADVVVTMAFSDNDSHGVHQFGMSNSSGRWSTQVPIPADAPVGEGRILAATSLNGKGNAGARDLLVVAATGRCP